MTINERATPKGGPNNVQRISMNNNSVIDLNKKKQEKKDAKNKKISHTELVVKHAIEDSGIRISGKGAFICPEGNFVKFPVQIVQRFFDRHKDFYPEKSVKIQFFPAFLAELVDEVKKREHNKIIKKIAIYEPDGEAEVYKLAKIMLEGLDFETSESNIRLTRFVWGIKSSIIQIKRKMRQLPIFDHKVIGFIGLQGHGDQKTEMVRRFAKPLGDFEDTMTVDELIDTSRNYERLANNYLLFLDDMHACSKKDNVAVKTIITADKISPRILGTHDIITVPVRSTFMTTSNTPLNEIFKDPTGSRRMLDLHVTTDKDRTRYLKLNEIDWLKLYQSIKFEFSQDEIMAYLKERDDIIAPFQAENIYKDYVSEFLEDRNIQDGKDFVEIGILYDALIAYINNRNTHERILSREQFSTRLINYGLTRIKRNKSGVFIDKDSFEGTIRQ